MLISSTKYEQSESNNTLKGSFPMIKWGLLQGCKNGSASTNAPTRYTTLTKDENYVIISIDAKKVFHEIQHPFLVKTLKEMDIKVPFFFQQSKGDI